MSSIRTLAAAVLAGFLVSNAPVASAGIVVFTDKASFLSAVQPGYYEENFDSLSPDYYPDTMPFSQGGFSYDVYAPGTLDFGGLQTFSDLYDPNDIWMSATYGDTDLTVNNLAGGVSAIGGNFFYTNFEMDFIEALITVEASDGVNTETLPIVIANPIDFIGFMTDDGSSFVSLVLQASGTGNLYGTMNNLVVGQAVPEPASFVMTAMGLAAAGFYAHRRRRQVQA